MKKVLLLYIILSLFVCLPILSQTLQQKITDSNTPLHALQPDYPVPYGPLKADEIKSVLNRLFTYLDQATPAKVIDSKTKTYITEMSKLSDDAIFEPGIFRIISYEWGVTYGAMLMAADATGDNKYSDYTIYRINLIADVADYFKKKGPAYQVLNSPIISARIRHCGHILIIILITYLKSSLGSKTEFLPETVPCPTHCGLMTCI
jgi:unsaturated rhamnogalacturonyl hydrolase